MMELKKFCGDGTKKFHNDGTKSLKRFLNNVTKKVP